MTIKYEGWAGDGTSGVCPASHATEHPATYALVTEDCKLVWTFESTTDDPQAAWTEAMTAWHQHQGWEPYVPQQ